MAERGRDGWRIELPRAPPARRHGACVGLKLRRPSWEDCGAIGALLLGAYRGTVDDEGEELDAAVRAARAYFEGKYAGPAMPRESVLAWRGDDLVGACLIGRWVELGDPFVVQIATAPSARGQGVGRLMLAVCVRRLSQAGYGRLLAVITRGNTPSERLFASLGFEVFERRDAPTS